MQLGYLESLAKLPVSDCECVPLSVYMYRSCIVTCSAWTLPLYVQYLPAAQRRRVCYWNSYPSSGQPEYTIEEVGIHHTRQDTVQDLQATPSLVEEGRKTTTCMGVKGLHPYFSNVSKDYFCGFSFCNHYKFGTHCPKPFNQQCNYSHFLVRH